MTENAHETERRLRMGCQRLEAVLYGINEVRRSTPRELLDLTSTQRGAYMAAVIQLAEGEKALTAALSNLKFALRESPR